MTQPPTSQANVWLEDVGRFDRMLAPFNDVIVDAAIHPGDDVLDVGCGAGASTFAAAERVGNGSVTGVDRDQALVEFARSRLAARLPTASVRFLTGDAASVDLSAGSFDALISRFGMMFFDDPTAAFNHLGRLVRPGGRIAYVTWTDPTANDWFALPFSAAGVPVPPVGPPFRLADPGLNRELLKAAGCSTIQIEMIDRPVFVGVDPADVMSFVRRELPTGTPARVLAAIAAALEGLVTDDGVFVNGRALVCTGTIGPDRSGSPAARSDAAAGSPSASICRTALPPASMTPSPACEQPATNSCNEASTLQECTSPTSPTPTATRSRSDTRPCRVLGRTLVERADQPSSARTRCATPAPVSP